MSVSSSTVDNKGGDDERNVFLKTTITSQSHTKASAVAFHLQQRQGGAVTVGRKADECWAEHGVGSDGEAHYDASWRGGGRFGAKDVLDGAVVVLETSFKR